MPKYKVGDWITWMHAAGRDSKVCSECGHIIYGPDIKEPMTGKIKTIFSTLTKTKEIISYCVRVDLETEVVLKFVAEEKIIEWESKEI